MFVAFIGVFFVFLMGFYARLGYDTYNQNEMKFNFERYNEIPEEKSMSKALLLTSFLGGIGLIYSSPKTGVPLALTEYLLLLISFGLLAIITRPLMLLFAWNATSSYNKTAYRLFGQLGGDRG